MIEAVGSDRVHTIGGTSSNDRIISQIQSRQSKWKVLEDDEGDENDDADGGIKIEDF